MKDGKDYRDTDVFLIPDDDGEDDQIIPFFTHIDTKHFSGAVPSELPLVELRNNVFFPRTITPIAIGRSRTQRLVRELPDEGGLVVVVAQKNAAEDRPTPEGLYSIGTLGMVLKIIELPGRPTTLVVQGIERVEIEEFVSETPYFEVRYRHLPEKSLEAPSRLIDAKLHVLRERAQEYVELASDIPTNLLRPMLRHDNDEVFVNFLAMQMNISTAEKQHLLESELYEERIDELLQLIQREIQTLELRKEIQTRTKNDLDEQQREYILQQQLRTIRDELGESDEEDDVEKFWQLGKKKKWNAETKEVFEREVNRLRRMNPMSPDYAIQTSYLQFFTDLPWGVFSKDNHDLARAQRVLDEDHFGLEQVKERILEYLAVLTLKKDLKSPIICLHGPPGVGKTSLGKSVARALGRKYARISLGGLHDESEIRGHRKTYVGALPGRILQNLRKVKTSNPVFILDEIDKITSNMMGDPASALLEVLDPEQNSTFYDNYLEVEYDLSNVLFITTANDISAISPPLRDRMEMIEMNGYLIEEKVSIATQHLIPNQIKQHGLTKAQFKLSDDMLADIIDNYTRESGVRKLDQTIAKLVRQQAKSVALKEKYNTNLTTEDVRKRLGAPRYQREADSGTAQVGVAVGMAWTQVGGEVLYVETSLAEGKGQMTLTGNLGDVMKESATIALQIVKAHANELGIDATVFEKTGVHVHVPEGAIPKDGPSAGVTMLTSLVSSFTERPPRAQLAMTGEVTLRGKVLPVGGIKEKILAAKRANLKYIILPADNQKDIEEIKPVYIEGLEFSYVSTVDELLSVAFKS